MPTKKISKKQKLSSRELAKQKAKLAKEKAKASALKFKREIKKAVSTAIVAAFGFLIALVWKEVITEYVNNLTAFSPFQGKLIEAIIVTIIAVLGILIATKVFSVEKK